MIRQNRKLAEWVFRGAAVICALVTLAVFVFLAVLSLPVLKSGNFIQVLTTSWAPDHGRFGILPMIAGTFSIALLSLVFSFPVSLGCALFIRVVEPGRTGRLLKKMVQMMTAVPTVVYGFVGVFALVPVIRQLFSRGSGMCILSAALMLAILISPTLILFFSQGVESVPRAHLNAADALGAGRFQKLIYVILPHAWPGIVTGVVLAFGRAMGDTLIALMISGNSVMLPGSVLDSARTLTAHIAMIIAADFDSMEFKILFVCGSVLYLLTAATITAARFLEKRKAV